MVLCCSRCARCRVLELRDRRVGHLWRLYRSVNKQGQHGVNYAANVASFAAAM